MTITRYALTLLAGIGAGCTTVPPATVGDLAALPNCFDNNYDQARGLFTMKRNDARAVNEQCLLTIKPGGDVASPAQLTAGNYRLYLADGGGGGAGGTLITIAGGARAATGGGGGGGGGGGAGAMEIQTTAFLSEGTYKLTLGSGGPGGMACMPDLGIGGGTGWAGSPSSMVRVATGETIIGTAGADIYARPSRAQNELSAGKLDGHGGSGPGLASGGDGAASATLTTAKSAAEPGESKLASGIQGMPGAAGFVGARDEYSGAGGGGGATSVGSGGAGGGESPGQAENAAKRGTLGGGGGGGEGSRTECDPGARGGHGYIALRKI